MKPNKDTIIRTACVIAALINQLLTTFGKNPLPFSETDVYTGLSAVFTTVTALIAWWKNNSFTYEAIAADVTLKEMRNQK